MSSLDGGSPFDGPEIIESATEAIEKLRAYEDESVDPDIAEFARLVADRINGGSIVPAGFIMASTLLIYDLQTGVSGFTGEPMESNLVGITGAEEAKVRESIPNLARLAFSGSFADQVESSMQKIGLIAPAESVNGQGLDENEIITEKIESIDEAQDKIVADARERIADLDWQHFGIDTEEVYRVFGAAYLLCLRQAPYDLPVNVLVDEPGKERGLLLELPDDQKKHVVDKYWLALTSDKIDPQFATFTRDHLLLKVPEVIAGMNDLDVPEALMHMAGKQSPERGPLGRAVVRMQNFMQEHPELLQEE